MGLEKLRLLEFEASVETVVDEDKAKAAPLERKIYSVDACWPYSRISLTRARYRDR